MTTVKCQVLLTMAIAGIMMSSCKNQESTTTSFTLDYTADSVEIVSRGIISTALYERDIAISPSGDELLFTRGDHHQNYMTLMRMEKKNGLWEMPKVLPFSGKFKDIEPFISPDGNKLYFASDRPMPGHSGQGDYNIWVCDKTGKGWSGPSPLDSQINTSGNEFYPSVSGNGNLYFTASKPGGFGNEDIWLSRFVNGQYQQPVPLDSNVNSETWEFNAFVSPDESLIIFSSFGRKDGLGGGDLYYSQKNASGSWSPAIHFKNDINSDKLDFCPFYDARNKILYFTSERMDGSPNTINSAACLDSLANSILNGNGNIYRVKFDTGN